MSETAADQATIAETVVFLSHFKDLPDPRQAAKVLYKLAACRTYTNRPNLGLSAVSNGGIL